MDKLRAYRRAMQECRRFGDYNFKEYFLMRSRAEFRLPTWTTEKSKAYLNKLNRLATVQSLYPSGKAIIESVSPTKLGRSLD